MFPDQEFQENNVNGAGEVCLLAIAGTNETQALPLPNGLLSTEGPRRANDCQVAFRLCSQLTSAASVICRTVKRLGP